jgi:ElaB/YqjD/DUF883 family membrane-anchored ribosome-binding protein
MASQKRSNRLKRKTTEDSEVIGGESEDNSASPKNETKKLKMGEDLAAIVKLFEKQKDDIKSEVKKVRDDVEKIIERSHNELKGSIDDIKSEVKKVKDDVEKRFDDLKAEIDDRDQQLLKEIALQDDRKTEIIMFKIDKLHVENQEDSKKYDMSEVQKTLKEVCKIEETDIVFCKRIGIRNPNRNGPRPVVVRLKSMAQRDEVLDSANHAGKPGIDANLTPKQQAMKKTLLTEMKSKNELAGQLLYKVVGRTAFRLVKRQKKNDERITE